MNRLVCALYELEGQVFDRITSKKDLERNFIYIGIKNDKRKA
jgi:hypothetical protein